MILTRKEILTCHTHVSGHTLRKRTYSEEYAGWLGMAGREKPLKWLQLIPGAAEPQPEKVGENERLSFRTDLKVGENERLSFRTDLKVGENERLSFRTDLKVGENEKFRGKRVETFEARVVG